MTTNLSLGTADIVVLCVLAVLILLALSWLGLGGNALGNAIYSVYAALFHIFF